MNNKKHNKQIKSLVWKFIICIILLFSISSCSYNQNQQIDVGFSPGHSASYLILKVISQAQHTIDIAAYSFTSKSISLALLEAHKRGVKIRIIADYKANSNNYTATTYLANQKISVRLNKHYSIMHNKFIIIDSQILETGSYNYTSAADKHNAENIIILYHYPEIAFQYTQEFNRLWEQSVILPPQY
ncbi:MAG: phospholipase D family protein [Candidatus Dasytiphilus stammeri]